MLWTPKQVEQRNKQRKKKVKSIHLRSLLGAKPMASSTSCCAHPPARHPTRSPGMLLHSAPPFPAPGPPGPAPSLSPHPSSVPCRRTMPALRNHPVEAGERPRQSSPAMRGIPARQPSREIHLCGPDSEGLFGAKPLCNQVEIAEATGSGRLPGASFISSVGRWGVKHAAAGAGAG